MQAVCTVCNKADHLSIVQRTCAHTYIFTPSGAQPGEGAAGKGRPASSSGGPSWQPYTSGGGSYLAGLAFMENSNSTSVSCGQQVVGEVRARRSANPPSCLPRELGFHFSNRLVCGYLGTLALQQPLLFFFCFPSP